MTEQTTLPIPGQGTPPPTPFPQPERPKGIDYSVFRNAAKESWRDLVAGDDLAQDIKELVTLTALLPRGDFQVPIVATYLMLASCLCNHVPILFSHGSPGSGKSALAHLACKIHGINPIGANSTPASLRNSVMGSRFGEPIDGQYIQLEQHAILAWEDVNPTELRKYEFALFNLLKLGIDRDATIQIATEKGKNMEFYPFSPKYVSSIHPIYSEHQYRELVRRVIVIQHKKFSDWTHEDQSEIYKGAEPDDLIDLESYSWEGINAEFHAYWKDTVRLERYASLQKSLTRKRSHGIDRALWKISKDLICTGVICGFWDDLDAAIEHIRQYWNWHYANVESQASPLTQILKKFVERETENAEKSNALAIEHGIPPQPVEIAPPILKKFVMEAIATGHIPLGTPLRDCNDAMAALGWKMCENLKGHMVWMKQL